MEEKAELLFNPGCEAWSEYCEGCDFQRACGFCQVYDETLKQTEWESNFRCRPCLEAEAKANEMREKIEKIIERLKEMEQEIPRHESGKFYDSHYKGLSDGIWSAIDELEEGK